MLGDLARQLTVLLHLLVAEMPGSGEHHGDAVFVGRLDDLVVAHRAARLDDRGRSGFDRHQQTIGKRERTRLTRRPNLW